MKIEVKHRITYKELTYEPGVHDLPEDLCRQFLAEWPWSAARLAKVKLIHPITHDGTEYGRGIYELPENTVRLFLKNAPHAAVPFDEAEPAAFVEPQPASSPTSVRKAGPQHGARGSTKQKIEEHPGRPRTWKDIEITFLSEFRLQIEDGEALNYAELGFADTRGGKDKPTAAWLTFRKLAESRGRVMVPKSDPQRRHLEKRIQEIRAKLREYFGIPEDPLPFIKDETHVGYRAEFKIACGPSYET